MEQRSELDLKRILRLIFAKKALFLATAIIVTTVMIIETYLWPKKYEAKSMIFIERNVINELIKDVTVTPSFEEKIKAVTIVMKSRSLILKVMSDLDIDLKNKKSQEIEALVKNFQDNTEITVEISKDSRKNMDLFHVTHINGNPKMASDFVNALVRRYIEENLSIKREEAYGANRFLLEQIDTFKAKLAKTESAITKLSREKGISESKIAGTDPSQRSLSPSEQLLALTRKKIALLSQYTVNHPEVIKINAEIELVKEQIRTAPPALERDDKELTDLIRERDTIRKIYEDLLSTLNKSEVSTQVEIQDKAGAFRILDPAIVPTRPISPDITQMLLLSVLTGAVSAAGLLIGIDLTDSSVKTVDTLKKMGLPILAVIPNMKTEQETAAVRKKNVFIYTIAGLYLACLLAITMLEMAGISPMNDLIQEARIEISNTLQKMR